MQDEYRTQQAGTTVEEWERGLIPSHSARSAFPRRRRNRQATPPPAPPPPSSVKLTPDQMRQLQGCAHKQGLSTPELLRRLIGKELARGRPEKAMLAVRERLGRHKLTVLERRLVWEASVGGRRSGASATQHWGPDVYLTFLAEEE